jgi:anti-sigma factor RsiW
MEHADVQPKLSDYLDHAVPPEEKPAIEGHLAACPDCRKALAELVATRRHVQSLAEVDPPPWLTGKIMARVREQADQKRGLFQRLFYPLHIKLPMEALGLIFLTVTAYFIFRNIQPEMGPLITPSREVYERAQPTGPQTATPLESPEEKKQSLKKEERSMAGKSVEPPPKMNKAMPLEGSAAKPEETPKRAITPGLQADRRMKLEEMAAKPAERSEIVGKQAAMPAPAAQATRPSEEAVARQERRVTEAPTLTAKKLALDAQPLQLTLNAKDAAAVGLKVEEAVTRLGGKTVKKESFESTQLLFVQVDVRKVDELLITLEHLGEVKEKISPAKEGEGTRMITIKIIPISSSP